MEDMETPTERTQEDIHHHAEHSRERWISWVALSSALLAGLAAVCVLLAGSNANEGMLKQLESNDRWSQYQAKGIKAQGLRTKMEILTALSKPIDPKDEAKLEKYAHDQESLSEIAEKATKESEHHMDRHETFAYGVTMFQVAIAVAAISVLSKRTMLWFVGLGFGAFGIVFLIWGLLLYRDG